MSFKSSVLVPYLAESYDLGSGSDRKALRRKHGGVRRTVFDEVLRQARGLGARTGLVEYRYFDPDYRNEHSRFYSTTFRRYPSVASRLHFFAEEISDPDQVADDPAVLESLTYLGYTVLRPVPAAPIGRTMLLPPAFLRDSITCSVRDDVHVFGSRLSVNAAPFLAQDGQLGVCAHASVWMTAYQHHLGRMQPRRLPGHIQDAVPGATGLGRPVPASALSVHQLSQTYASLGLPALVYFEERLPPGEDVDAILCRYLNSGLPVTVAAGHHTFVLVGYVRTADDARKAALAEATASAEQLASPIGLNGPLFAPASEASKPSYRSPLPMAARNASTGKAGRPGILYICQDDETGPYQVRKRDGYPYGPWQYLIVPLPDKVYLPGEDAESLAWEWIGEQVADAGTEDARRLRRQLHHGELSMRCVMLSSNDFKRILPARGANAEVVAFYRRTQMSRLVWVVEIVNRALRNAGKPCVIGEIIVDATAHGRDPHVLAYRLPGVAGQWFPDLDQPFSTDIQSASAMDVIPMPLPSAW